MEKYIKTDWVDFETVITEELMDKIEGQLELVTDETISLGTQITDIELTPGPKGDPGEQGEQGEPGPTGMPGMTARNIELRKTGSNIEWRHSTNVLSQLDLRGANPTVAVNKEDTVTKLVLANRPSKAAFAQIKTITVFGSDANGKPIANLNPSVNTAPEGTTFPCFGGFDPTNKTIIDIRTTNEIEGNMLLQKVMDDCLPMLKKVNTNITQIDKVTIWVYLLDEAKEELECKKIIFNIANARAKSVESAWKTLVSLSDITGPKGNPGTNGKSAYELAVQEGFVGDLNAWLESLKANYDTQIADLTKRIEALEQAK